MTTKKMENNENKKSPRALDPAVVLPPPPGGCKICYGQTQDKSHCLCSERHDEYLFGRAKTGGLGQVTTKKNHGKKMGITTPRPDDGLKKKKKQTRKILCQCTFEMALLLQCA